MPPIDDQLPDPDQPLVDPPGGYATGASPEAAAEFFERLVAEFANRGIVASAAPTNLRYDEFLRLVPRPLPRIAVASVLTVVHDTPQLYHHTVTRRGIEKAMQLPGTVKMAVDSTLGNFERKFRPAEDDELKHCALFYRPTLLTYLVDTDVPASKLLRQWNRERLNT